MTQVNMGHQGDLEHTLPPNFSVHFFLLISEVILMVLIKDTSTTHLFKILVGGNLWQDLSPSSLPHETLKCSSCPLYGVAIKLYTFSHIL